MRCARPCWTRASDIAARLRRAGVNGVNGHRPVRCGVQPGKRDGMLLPTGPGDVVPHAWPPMSGHIDPDLR